MPLELGATMSLFGDAGLPIPSPGNGNRSVVFVLSGDSGVVPHGSGCGVTGHGAGLGAGATELGMGAVGVATGPAGLDAGEV